MATATKKTPAKKTAPKAAKPKVMEVKTPVANVVAAVNVETVKVEPVKVVRRKELVERIVANSGMKPNQIKTVLDAVLKELGDVLSAGEILQVQPLGKISVNRRKDIANGEVLICKLRRKSPVTEPTLEIAE